MSPSPSLAPAPARAATGFTALGVPSTLDAVLRRDSITEPFPIQAATLPDSLAGRNVLARGRTGSGKTVAFAIPTVMAVASTAVGRRPGHPRGLILVPTRELALQVAEVVSPLAKALSLTCTTVFGGVPQGRQVTALRAGADIVVACPGRLEDLIAQRHCALDRAVVTVLDEADHMADLGFLPAVRRLLDQTPANAQRLLFSATLDNGVDTLVRRYVPDAVTHAVDPHESAPAEIVHHVLAVAAADKFAVIRDLAGASDRVILFTRTKHGAKKYARQLSTAGVPAGELHGNLSQGARQRNLDDFSSGRIRALVATDIAARGIHVDDVALVVHIDPPAEHKAYLHRSGRTARAGAAGVVVTVMTPDQADDVRRLAKAAGVRPITTAITPGHDLIGRLAGPASAGAAPATTVRPAPAAQADVPARLASERPRQGQGQGQGRGHGQGHGAANSPKVGRQRRRRSGAPRTPRP